MAEHYRRRRTHRWAFPLGVILTALAIVGAVALARLAGGAIQERIDNPKEKAEYEAFLADIVAYDPDPFDSVQGMPDKNVPQLLGISLWAILKDPDNKPDHFSMDNEGRMQIPKALVEAKYERLFGVLPPRHATVEGTDFDFVYDPDKEIYLVPTTSMFKIYAPSVTDIKKTGSSIELTVDYLAFDNQLNSNGRPADPEPSKTMIITLYEMNDDSGMYYQVGAIHQPAGVGTAEGQTVLS